MENSLVDEFKGCDLGDLRRSKRLVRVADSLGMNPNLSLPAALHGRAELEAAYRLFDNDDVAPNEILSKHFERSIERVSNTSVALLVQDTTDIDLTRPTQQVVGTGPMESNGRHGAFLHPLIAFDPQGIPLGITWAKMWAREMKETDEKEDAKAKRKRLRETPIEDKESIRWIEGLRAARDVAKQCHETDCVLVADSEADIYELFVESRETGHDRPLHLLIRACQDRALATQSGCFLKAIREQPCQYQSNIQVSQRRPKAPGLENKRKRQKARDARSATVEVRVGRVTLKPPQRNGTKLPEVTVNVVLVEETSPPEGAEPIQWILITTLPIDTNDQVKNIVSYYCKRWGIEVYNKTLKSGCRVEERQFHTLSRELNCLAVYMVIAWRILMLVHLGRECPDLSCEVAFEPSEWKAVYMIAHGKQPPATPPTLNEIVRLIATFGGFTNRKTEDPGTQTLWIGLQRAHDFAHGYDSFGPGSKKLFPTCVV